MASSIDPDGEDPALRNLVLIGHSQGGLLARLMVTDSGTRFWDAVVSDFAPQCLPPAPDRSI